MKNSFRCVICGTRLTSQNKSPEHIIPQAIGGRRTTDTFICGSCNNGTGGQWDKDLTEQLAELSLLLGTKRQKGQPHPITVSSQQGQLVKLHNNGDMFPAEKPSVEEHYDKETGKGSIRIHASNAAQAQAIADGMKKKWEQKGATINLPAISENVTTLRGQVEVKMSLGYGMTGKSLVKTVLSHAHHSGVSADECDEGLAFLLQDGPNCYGNYYSKEVDAVTQRPDHVFHCVSIIGIPDQQLLLGYVEYFSTFRNLICLSKKYSGKELSFTYALNLQTGEEIDLHVELPIGRQELVGLTEHALCDLNVMKEALWSLRPHILAQSMSVQFEKYEAQMVPKVLEEMGIQSGDEVTERQHNEFAGRMAQLMAEFWMREMNHLAPAPPISRDED